MSGFISEIMESQGIPNELAMITSVFTLAVAILASVIGRGFLSVIPVFNWCNCRIYHGLLFRYCRLVCVEAGELGTSTNFL